MTGWTTACPDWEQRIREGRSLIPCSPLFPAQAERGLKVFRSLAVVDAPHPQGLIDEFGRPVPPTVEEACRAWAMEIAEAIHGAYDEETGERLLREVLIKIPKKNWKSGFAACLMLSLMVLNWRPSNEAGIIAPSKDLADNVFKPMRDAIKADPQLDALFHIQPNMRTVTHRVTGMSCRVYAADTDSVSGKKWAFVVFEELWLLAQRKGAEDMVLEATGGQASRPEGVVISITTESDDEPVGVYKAKIEFARAVRDGKVSAPHFLPILYEWPAAELKSKAYLDPASFHLVNPNYGASVDPDDMVRKFEEARAAGGKSLRVFLAKRLNVPPSEQTGGSWAGAEFWRRQADESIADLDEFVGRCEVIVAGIDGGGLDDLLGLALIGRERETRRWLHWGAAWAHKIVLDRRKDIAETLMVFAEAGDLTLVERPGDDLKQVADIICWLNACGMLPEKHAVGVDAAGIGTLVDELTAPHRGITAGDGGQIVAIQQGWRLNGAILTTERALAGGELVHGGIGLMAWCVDNAKAEPRGNAVTITKQTAGSAKIDPVAALFDAVTLMALNPEARGEKFQMLIL